MAKHHVFMALLGGVALALLVAGLVAQHVGVNETALFITVGMLCGPALAASALVGTCSLLRVHAVEVHKG